MTTLREAAQQALEALQDFKRRGHWGDFDNLTGTLQAALVEDAMQKFTDVNQELMAALGCDHCNHPLYAAIKCQVCGRVTEPAPPQRKPLTEEEIDSIWDSEKAFADIYAIARAIERAHGIGGDE